MEHNQLEFTGSNSNLYIGSFIREGSLHSELSLGLQDARYIVDRSNLKVAIICDGCSIANGGLTQNYVGATLGAQFIGSTLAAIILREENTNNQNDFDKLLRITRSKAKTCFRRLCNSMGMRLRDHDQKNEYREFVLNKLLFTVLGFVVFGNHYWIFGLGDGCYGINDKIEVLEPAEYLNQSLWKRGEPKEQFKVYERGSINTLKHLWISSDGLYGVLSSSRGKINFKNFLNDEYTCMRNSKGEDTTIQAFNRNIYKHHKTHLSDDVALAIVRIKDVRLITKKEIYGEKALRW